MKHMFPGAVLVGHRLVYGFTLKEMKLFLGIMTKEAALILPALGWNFFHEYSSGFTLLGNIDLQTLLR